MNDRNENTEGLTRKDFIRIGSTSAAGHRPDRLGALDASTVESTGKLPRREFGTTGVYLSTIGMGGIVVRDAQQEHANRIVAEFVERGMNYFHTDPMRADNRAAPH